MTMVVHKSLENISMSPPREELRYESTMQTVSNTGSYKKGYLF